MHERLFYIYCPVRPRESPYVASIQTEYARSSSARSPCAIANVHRQNLSLQRKAKRISKTLCTSFFFCSNIIQCSTLRMSVSVFLYSMDSDFWYIYITYKHELNVSAIVLRMITDITGYSMWIYIYIYIIYIHTHTSVSIKYWLIFPGLEQILVDFKVQCSYLTVWISVQIFSSALKKKTVMHQNKTQVRNKSLKL